MSASPARAERASPWIWLLPVLALALVGLFWLERGRVSRPNAPPTVASPDETVAGFAARAALEPGALRVRLVPLHPDAERQRFDRLALARRLSLAAGEPWRLSLELDDAAAAAEIDLARLAVLDRDGLALAPLAAVEPSAQGPSDPLRTLLTVGRERLAPGRTLDVVLWGRAPGDGVRLLGLHAAESEGLPLERALHRRAELEAPLARLERADGELERGKSAATRASDAPGR